MCRRSLKLRHCAIVFDWQIRKQKEPITFKRILKDGNYFNKNYKYGGRHMKRNSFKFALFYLGFASKKELTITKVFVLNLSKYR